MNRTADWSWRGFGVLTVVFMMTPLVLVIIFSFGESAMTNFPMGGVTFKWYEELFATREFWNAFRNTMIIAAFVAITSTVIGTMAAIVLARMRPKLSGPWLIALCLPIMMPPLVVGVALLVYFVRWVEIELSLVTVILGHLLVTQPFVILIVYARMATFDYAVVDSARDLGAGPWTTFVTVTLPIVRSTINWCSAHRACHLARRVHHYLLQHRRRQHAADLCVRQDPHDAGPDDQCHRHDPDRFDCRLDGPGAQVEPLSGLERVDAY